MASLNSDDDAGAVRRRPRLDRLRSLGLAAVACVVGLLTAELGLYLIGFTYVTFYYPDPVLGWVYRAGAQGVHKVEGRAAIKINRYGFRDHEWEAEKPRDRFRVAVLGDSYTAAMQVAQEQRFTSILEKGLRSCDALAGRVPEVLNFGVGGWGTGQELLCLRDRVWRFDPDLLVLAFFPGNDVANNSKQLEPNTARPYFSLQGGKLVRDDSFRNQPTFRRETSWWNQTFRSAAFSLRTAQVLARAMDARKERTQRGARSWQSEGPVSGGARAPAESQEERGLTLEVYFDPSTPAWDEAWRLTEALLIETAAQARRHGSPFSLLLVSTSTQVRPGAAERAHAMGLEDLLYPNRRLVELGHRHGFPVLSLAEPFLARAEADGLLFHGFNGETGGHWNVLGHRVAGELLTTEVCSQLTASGASAQSDE